MRALATIGDNLPPDPFTLFAEEIDDLVLEAKNWLDGSGVNSEADEEAVAQLLSRLRKANADADKARADEKRPHDEAGKAVQVRWKPILDTATLAISTARQALTPYLQAKEAAQRAIADAARAEATRKAQEAQAALQASSGDLSGRIEAEALLKDANAAERDANRADKVKAQAKGGERAIGLRSVWDAEVTDARAALNHYLKAEPSAFHAVIADLASKDVRAGKRVIPGVTITERKTV